MRLAAIVRREFLERIRSKAFLVSTILGPLMIGALILVPALVGRRGGPLKLAILDASGTLQKPLERALSRLESGGGPLFRVVPTEPGPIAERIRRLHQQVLDGRLDGFLFLPEDALQASVAEYHGRNVSNLPDLKELESATEDALVDARLTRAGLDPARLEAVTRHLDLRTIRVSKSGEREDRGGSFLLSVILLMMIYTTILLWGQALMTSVIEEKSSRVVEILASSVKPSRLLAGKLLGVGAAGLLQFLVWTSVLASFGVYGTAAAGRLHLPDIPPAVLASFVVFFLLGYFLYGSLYAAVGAAVNTVQEAQGLVFPVLGPILLAMVFFPVVMNSPDGALSVALSLIPLMTPLLMFLRIVTLPPPAWQVGLSIVLTLATIVGVVYAAARVYRVGILMYGKRPTFPEILRWIRRP